MAAQTIIHSAEEEASGTQLMRPCDTAASPAVGTGLNVAAREFVPTSPAALALLKPSLSADAPAFVPRTASSPPSPSPATTGAAHSSGTASPAEPASTCEAGGDAAAPSRSHGSEPSEAEEASADVDGLANSLDSASYGDGCSTYYDEYGSYYGYSYDESAGQEQHGCYCCIDPTTGGYWFYYPDGSCYGPVDEAEAVAMQAAYSGYSYDPATASYTAGTAADDEYGAAAYAAAAEGDTDQLLEQLQGVSMPSREAAELLRLFFPAYSDASLQRLFEASSGDLATAYQDLCATEQQVAQQRQQQQPRQQQQRQQVGAKHATPAKRSPAFTLDQSAFPSLGAGASPAKPAPAASEQPSDAAPGTSADAGGEAGAEQLPVQPVQAPAQPAAPPPKLNFAALVKASSAAAEGSAAAAAVPAAAAAPAKRPAAPAPAPTAAAAAAQVPWVTTGEAVSREYADARSEASGLARLRNQYFQQATLAYLSGNKALAKELGRKGRQANQAMKAAHTAAARKLFTSRNPPAAAAQQQQHSGAGGGRPKAGRCGADGGAVFVDLHGLHAKEAKALLEEQIDKARASGASLLRVCVGAGHHTKGGAKAPARLPAAVADTLLANHLTFRTLQPGLLEAQL